MTAARDPKCGGVTGSADQKRVLHRVQRRSIQVGETNPDNVGAILGNHRTISRHALKQGLRIGRHFLRRKTCPGSERWIDE